MRSRRRGSQGTAKSTALQEVGADAKTWEWLQLTVTRQIYSFALLVRLVLMTYGAWQDANFVVKYTDVDYQVFTEASAHVLRGNSPYNRATYRYTPLLAYMMLPNVLWGGVLQFWGKIIFVAADLAVGYLLERVLVMRG